MGQFNLKLSFFAVCVLRKDIQDQGSTVDNFYLFAEELFQVPLLSGSELVVKDKRYRVRRQDLGQFFHLSRAQVGLGVGISPLTQPPDYTDPSGPGQRRELFQGILEGILPGLLLA